MSKKKFAVITILVIMVSAFAVAAGVAVLVHDMPHAAQIALPPIVGGLLGIIQGLITVRIAARKGWL